MKVNFESNLIAIVGLGYVGLPLAVEFGKLRDVVGFDINKKRINELKDNSGSQFDPHIVKCFLNAIKHKDVRDEIHRTFFLKEEVEEK